MAHHGNGTGAMTVIRDMRPSAKQWVADITNMSVRHESGFEIKFTCNADDEWTGRVVSGRIQIDNYPPEQQKMRLEWEKQMLKTGSEQFFAALKMNLH